MINPELYVHAYGIGTLAGITIVAYVAVWRWIDEVISIRGYEAKARKIVAKYGSNESLMKEIEPIHIRQLNAMIRAKYDVEFSFIPDDNVEEVMEVFSRYGYKIVSNECASVRLSRSHLHYE